MSIDAVARLPRPLLGTLSGLAAVAVLSTLVMLGAWDLGPLLEADTLSVATGLLSAGCCTVAALVTTGAMRFSWSCFALTMALYAGGDFLWLMFGGAEGSPPILGVADALYMAAFLPGVAGVLLYPVLSGVRGMWGPLALDAAVLTAAVLFITHVLVLDTVFTRSEDGLEAFMLAVYPASDVLLACLAALLLLRSAGRPRPDVALVAATFAFYTAADSGYALLTLDGRDSLGTVVDLAYTLAPFLLAAGAAVAATMPTPRRTLLRHPRGLMVPLLPDLSALSALALATLSVPDVGAALLGTTTLVAVGVRQVVQTSAFQRLRAELERRVTQRTDELEELTGHYQRLDAMKYEFVTAVSHELRTPLTAIRGSLEMLHDGDAGELPASARSVVAIATRGSERLSRLVNDIIDLEGLESGAFGFSPAAHPLRALIDEATQSLGPLAEEQRVALSVVAAEGQAWCDADRVVQVLVNLIGNALKFSPTGSTVEVEAPTRGDEVLVSVRDQGRGIPADQLEAVFDRFHQVEMDDSRQKGGAGLGLTICQRIVDRHGGRIWVESPGLGATFRFTLPVAAPAAVEAPDSDPSHPSDNSDSQLVSEMA